MQPFNATAVNAHFAESVENARQQLNMAASSTAQGVALVTFLERTWMGAFRNSKRMRAIFEGNSRSEKIEKKLGKKS
jgi:hypothetical protein